ncbi:MAG: pyridoxamine 5'-phosphate oxidase family protein [Pseudomonadota bacterium]
MSDSERLQQIESDTWNVLARAVVDKPSPLRWFTFATVSPEGQPEARTVVLRAFDRASRRLTLYSDRRAAKIRALEQNPKAECHFFDSRQMLQFRLSGTAKLLTEGPRWKALFEKLPDHALTDYAALNAPGTPGSDQSASGLAEENFTVVDMTIAELDWLSLSREGHQRARYKWVDGGDCTAHFVVP